MIKWHTGTFLTVLRSRPLSAALAPAAGLPILAAPATALAKKKKHAPVPQHLLSRDTVLLKKWKFNFFLLFSKFHTEKHFIV